MSNQDFEIEDITEFAVDVTDEEILELSATGDQKLKALCIEAVYGDPVARYEIARIAFGVEDDEE